MTAAVAVAPTEEDVAETIARYEAAAIATGSRCEFDAPEFTADGVTWTQVWLSDDMPVAGRAVARRDGAATTVVVRWHDALPADELWSALWMRRPMVLFGAFLRRDAIRRAWRDVIGDKREPGDNAPTLTAAADAAPRDWEAEYLAAETVDALRTIKRAAQAARQNTDLLNRLFDTRKADMEALAAAAWTPAGLAQVADITEERAAEVLADVASFEPGPVKPGAPQDHLPGNRAARRAAARKKGGRR